MEFRRTHKNPLAGFILFDLNSAFCNFPLLQGKFRKADIACQSTLTCAFQKGVHYISQFVDIFTRYRIFETIIGEVDSEGKDRQTTGLKCNFVCTSS